MGKWVTLDKDGRQPNNDHRHLKAEDMPKPDRVPADRMHLCAVHEAWFYGVRSEHERHDTPNPIGDVSKVVHTAK